MDDHWSRIRLDQEPSQSSPKGSAARRWFLSRLLRQRVEQRVERDSPRKRAIDLSQPRWSGHARQVARNALMTRPLNTSIARLLPILAIVLALVADSAHVLPTGLGVSPAAAQSDDGDEGSDDGDDDKEDEDEDGKKGDEDEDDADKDKKAKDDEKQVTRTATFLVAVSCAYTAADDRSACGFVGMTERGIDEVGGIVVPGGSVCAPVVGGVFEETDDPASGGSGYRSPKDAGGVVTLILSGNVTTTGTTTYWVLAGEALLPATGPALGCATNDASATLDLTDADVSDSAGAIEVQAYTCGAVPDPEAIEWFDACDPMTPGIDLSLADEDKATAGEPARTGTSDDAGLVIFGQLAPGTYILTETNGVWCHAESDSVNADGDITVQAGQRATVWIFHCD